MQTKTQLQTIFEYLQNHIATASMVAEATVCQLTGFKAWYITTDKSKFTRPVQLEIPFSQP